MMKNKTLLIILLLVSLQCLSLARTNSPEATIVPALSLIDDLRDIISKLEVDSPKLIDNFTEQDKQKILKAFVESLDVGIKLGEPETNSSFPLSDKIYKPFSLATNDYLYVRVDSLVTESIDLVQNELDIYLAHNYSDQGCILDLRNCSGYEMSNAIALLKLLRTAKSEEHIQLSLLIGHNTKGSSEILTKIFESEKLGITLGAETAGKPLPQKELTLSSGGKMKLPELNQYTNFIDIKPVQPRLAIANNQQVTYEDLYSTMNGESRDKCLSQAIDLMVTIGIMQ